MTQQKDTFSPVLHTPDDDEKLFANPEFKKAWDALDERFAALSELLQTLESKKDHQP